MEALREQQNQWQQQNLRFVEQLQQQKLRMVEEFDRRNQQMLTWMLELLREVVDEEEEVSKDDGCAEHYPLADASQVLEESPKGSIQLSLDDGFGEGQGKVPGGFVAVPCEPLDGLNPSN